jgi:hypothetical protein
MRPGTCHLMRGEPYLMRILGFGFRGPKNRVPGLDVAARGRSPEPTPQPTLQPDLPAVWTLEMNLFHATD